MENDVCRGFVTHVLYYVGVGSLYAHFLKSIYHKMVLNLFKSFFCIYLDYHMSFIIQYDLILTLPWILAFKKWNSLFKFLSSSGKYQYSNMKLISQCFGVFSVTSLPKKVWTKLLKFNQMKSCMNWKACMSGSFPHMVEVLWRIWYKRLLLWFCFAFHMVDAWIYVPSMGTF